MKMNLINHAGLVLSCLPQLISGKPLTRPSATLSPLDGERDGVRGTPHALGKSALAVLMMSVVALFWLGGCASTPKVDWDSRVGVYTYDQVVTEMGPPDKQTTLSDGRLVADWITGRRGGSSVGFGFGTYGGGVGVGVGQTVGSSGYDRILRLTFGTDGKLADWQKR